jgi:hypothetical protein
MTAAALRAWWIRLPGFVIAAAAAVRAEWLWSHPADSINDAWWLPLFVVWFGVVGAVNLGWHLSAPWRKGGTATGTAVALFTFLCWMSYAIAITERIGWAIRATALDLASLAVMISWCWSPRRQTLGDDPA